MVAGRLDMAAFPARAGEFVPGQRSDDVTWADPGGNLRLALALHDAVRPDLVESRGMRVPPVAAGHEPPAAAGAGLRLLAVPRGPQMAWPERGGVTAGG
jgi:hypothetical protein